MIDELLYGRDLLRKDKTTRIALTEVSLFEILHGLEFITLAKKTILVLHYFSKIAYIRI